MEYLCECCKKYKAVTKINRDYAGHFSQYLVCEYCKNLSEYWFTKILTKQTTLDSKELLNHDKAIS